MNRAEPKIPIAEDNLFDYFDRRLRDARALCPVDLSEDTLLYLVNLLTERARADRPAPPEDTLAELHAAGANRTPSQQIRAYRELGDRALHLVGCFEESVARKIVGTTYYKDMGAAAYHRVDIVVKQWFSDAFGPVFTELAQKFERAVALLQTLRAAERDEVMALTARYPGLLLDAPVLGGAQMLISRPRGVDEA